VADRLLAISNAAGSSFLRFATFLFPQDA